MNKKKFNDIGGNQFSSEVDVDTHMENFISIIRNEDSTINFDGVIIEYDLQALTIDISSKK